MGEKLVFIDLAQKDLTGYVTSIFRDIINSLLADNRDIVVSDFCTKKDVLSVMLDTMNGNLESVTNPHLMLHFIERLYDYWRNYKRYVIIDKTKMLLINEDNFLEVFEHFNNFIISTYRKISQTLQGHNYNVYRQLPAGANAGILLDLKNGVNSKLDDISFISKIAFLTPFVAYSENNKRSGIFPIVDFNPLDKLNIREKSEWKCVPILAGKSHIFVYFKERYISLAVALANLFELDGEYKNINPDGIILFGYNGEDGIFHDKTNGRIIAGLQERDEIDYFGYLKKIILTVHNLRMIEKGKLPIHGAGVSILLKNNERKNVVLVGDSGAGKSETLEALRKIASDYIYDIETIYDDMGTLDIIDGKVYTYGTEIGAFVRTDDLANDYVYKVFDRAIFLNPNGKNARLVLPVSNYQAVIKPHEVNYILYANNYEEKEDKVLVYKDKDEALKVFKEGKRVALGTTSEKGLVKTFFANPFGPVQTEKETLFLLDKYFELMFKNNVLVGSLYTGLALNDPTNNALEAANYLLKVLKNER